MARSRVGLVALSLFLAGAGSQPEGARAPIFALTAPLEMVTGRVVVSAQSADAKVAAVKWVVDDWSRTTPRPFELTFDAGPVPYERRVTAVALDKDRRPLYRQETVINPGGRGLKVEFLHPVDGQQAAGALPVQLRVRAPADDEPEAVVLESGDATIPLARDDSGAFAGTVDVPDGATVLVARMKTRRGLETESTILVNGRGVLAESEAHVVEQLVGVTHGGTAVDDLGRADFTVKDEKGSCEVREAKLLRDAPVALGFAIDTSVSLRHTAELKLATANQFIEQCFTPKDAAFVLTFGPQASKEIDWTASKEALKKTVLGLQDYTVAGTALYEGILKAIYQFQGRQGARALVLITDGNDFDGDVPLEAALAYAKQSGVTIYALGLTSSYEKLTPVLARDEKTGEQKVVDTKKETIIQPTNTQVLSRFAEATGGKLYLVKKASDLKGIYERIERDIRTQYLVSFVTTVRRRNGFHPVEVEARKGRVRTASGFFY